MNIDATIAVNILFAWVLIATTLAYFLARKRVESVAPVVILHFLMAFIPPLSIIALLILANKDEIKTTSDSTPGS